MQCFDDLAEPPVVGRYYLVRCIEGWWGYPYRKGLWPVWGPKHDDAKHLNFPWPHYHLNRFFVPEDEIYECSHAPLTEEHPAGKNVQLPDPVMRRRKCRWTSDAIEFPLKDIKKPKWLQMFRSFSGTQCKRGNGWICPHKGFDLGSIAPGSDGVIICPLHGLRVKAESGTVI